MPLKYVRVMCQGKGLLALTFDRVVLGPAQKLQWFLSVVLLPVLVLEQVSQRCFLTGIEQINKRIDT